MCHHLVDELTGGVIIFELTEFMATEVCHLEEEGNTRWGRQGGEDNNSEDL